MILEFLKILFEEEKPYFRLLDIDDDDKEEEEGEKNV